jgi:two-component system response regulator FlrC
MGAELRGNIRELKNRLERAAILAEGPVLNAEDLALEQAPPVSAASERAGAGGGLTLDELERAAIERALSASAGNRKRAAELLGIGLRTLYDKLKRYDLS